MSCGCDTYECLEALVNPCSEGVELPLPAPSTDNLIGRVYFNNTVKVFEVAMTQGDNIIIPTDSVNENYTHEFRTYIGNTQIGCYHLKTMLSYDSATFTPVTPSTGGGLDGKAFTGNDSDSQTFTGLLGKTLLTVTMGGQDYTSDSWTQMGTTVTWNDSAQTFTGTIVLIWK